MTFSKALFKLGLVDVYWWFRRFVRRLLFCTIHDVTLMLDREREGREQRPTAAVVDSQSIKAPAAEKRAFDAGKKVLGRKRHIAVDTDGRLLMVNLTTADISDSAGAQTIVAAVRKRWPWLKHLFADGAYDRTRLMDAAAYQEFVLEIIRRSDKEAGFKVLPRRWVVERTFGWIDPVETARPRLRAADRRLGGHDPCRSRQSHAPQNCPSMNILKRTLSSHNLTKPPRID